MRTDARRAAHPVQLLVDPDPAGLASAWARPETFAVLPRRIADGTAEWVRGALAGLPSALRAGHFALLTSGSTGRPKLVVGERARAERLVELLHRAQGNEPARSTLGALPLTYSFAFVNQWLWAHVHGRELVLTAGLGDPPALREALRRARETMLCLVGTQGELLGELLGDATFPGVTRLHFAGGRFPQERLERIAAMFPSALITNNYGCAEALPRLTLRPASPALPAANVGRPLEGVELRADGEGRLLFRSPYRAVALVEGERTRRLADEEWLPSGDLAVREPDGSWRLLGRSGDVFKRHGEKVSLAAALDTARSVWPRGVAAQRAADRAGEDGYVLVLAPAPTREQLRALLAAFRAQHPRAQWPLRIEVAPRLPRLPNGKLDTAALAAQHDRAVAWDQRV